MNNTDNNETVAMTKAMNNLANQLEEFNRNQMFQSFRNTYTLTASSELNAKIDKIIALLEEISKK